MTAQEMNRIYMTTIQAKIKHPCVGDYSAEELRDHSSRIHAKLYGSGMLAELNVLDAVFDLAIAIQEEIEKLEELYYGK